MVRRQNTEERSKNMKKNIMIILAMMLTISVFAQPEGFKVYVNEKYQYSVLIPENFGGMGESESGDGQIFVSPDGDAHIQVYGGYNAMTLFGTSFDEEYQSTLKKFKDRKVKDLKSGTSNDPADDFDASYYIEYVEDGLYHCIHTIWWDDLSATADFWCYLDDKALYEEGTVFNIVVSSLSPAEGYYQSESEEVLDWYYSDDYALNVYVNGTLDFNEGEQPNIEDLFVSYATVFQTMLTILGLDIINDPGYEFEEIDEWVLDHKNNYVCLRLVSDSDYWMEACSLDKDNGHKLFVVNYNAPNQALMCFDYDPTDRLLYPDYQTLQPLQELIEAIVRLPREGKTIDVYYYKDLSKVVNRLTWNGKCFVQ